MAYKQRSPIIVGEGGTGATSLTDHGVVVGQDAAALTATAAGTDGQVIVAATLADPAFATLASLGGTVTFTLGANTLNLETGGAIASSFLTDDANSAVPALGVLTVSGGANIGTTSVASTVTIALNGLTDHAVHVGNAAGSLTALAIGATNEVLLGNTAADASWGTVGNAALTNSSVTLNNGNNITVTGSPLSLGGTASFDLTGCTQYAIQVGDATGSLDSLATGTATQIMQSGGAAAIPAWSTATYPATTVQGDVMFSSAANTVVGLVKDTNVTRYISNTGAASNPAWAQIELTNGVVGILPVASGGSGFATTTAYAVLCGGTTATNPFQPIAGVGTATQVLTSNGAGALPTFQDAGGGGLSWSESTGTTQALAVGTGYITNNVAQVVCTLPDTAALGSVIRICGKGAGGWRISQNAGESIIWDEGTSTTGGVGGYLASSDDHDAVEILCTVADTTWTVISSKGNITVV